MRAYPRYFTAVLWLALGQLIASGLLLAPGVFELRLEWDVSWSLPGGMRSVVAALHGLGAMFLLLLVGALLPMHVRSGLRMAGNRGSGITLLTMLAVLALTGWAIYYISNEDLSLVASTMHLGIGLLGLVPLAVHAVRGRRLRIRRSNAVISSVKEEPRSRSPDSSLRCSSPTSA